MLKINRLRVEINTMRGLYGIDESFGDGLNFIASRENTCGKKFDFGCHLLLSRL